MLYHLFLWLHDNTPWLSALNVTRYITFRTAAASITAMLISLVVGPILIKRLKAFQFGQVIRPEGPASHRPKAGTPTMGGLLILAAAIVPTLLWADLTSPYVWIAVALDGCLRGRRVPRRLPEDLAPLAPRADGPRYKMGGQIVVGLAVGLTLYYLAQQGDVPDPADLPVLQGSASPISAGASCRSPCSCS